MAVGDEEQQEVHVLMVPFQAEGHVNGMLRLAEALAVQQGVRVTFAYPARFYALASKRIASADAEAHASQNLRVEVVEDGLPLEEEQVLTAALLLASIPVFREAVTKLVLMKGTLTCIISDCMVPWTQALAYSFALPRFAFWTSTASSFSMSAHLRLLIAHAHIPVLTSGWLEGKRWKVEAPLVDCIPGLAPFPVTDLPSEFVQAEELSNPGLLLLQRACESAREAGAILVHSVYELEKEVFDALQDHGFAVHAIGPLLSSVQRPIHNSHECLQWLDTQPSSSVIYVALGTVAQLTAEQMHSLALGIEASGHPFLWVIRSDTISPAALSNTLPQGFLQRCIMPAGPGLIMPWVPQMEVLHHHSIGAFFSHCGWNSTLESMWEGVPMVACPLGMEQRSNARWIVKMWRMGVELERQVDGSFTKEAVQRALEEVVHQSYKKGALLAKEVSHHAAQDGGTSHSNLLHFVHLLHQLGLGKG